MSVDSVITGARSSRRAIVSKSNGLCVSPIDPDLPEPLTRNKFTLYNALLGTAGAVETGTVNANLGVDGSATNVEYYIGAEADIDIRIMKVVLVIADSQVRHNTFGNIAALANGLNLDMFERGINTSLLNDAKTGGHVIAQSGLSQPYGATTTSFQLSNWDGTNDAQTIVFNMHELVPGGIRIAHGTEDKIFATVRDDLTGLSEFTIRVLGYRHHE
jgi:hypothetical protein